MIKDLPEGHNQPEPQGWEKEWAIFCGTLAYKFTAMTPNQRTGVAGNFEIEGKSFIRNLLAEAEERGYDRGRETIVVDLKDLYESGKQAGMKETVVAPIIKEFIEATPAWLEQLEVLEHYSGRKQCSLCGMDPDKIKELHKALTAIQITNQVFGRTE